MRAESKRRADANLAQSHAAMSGIWPKLGRLSEHTDTAFVIRQFLASDVRMTAAESEAALDALIERGLVRAEYALSDERRLALNRNC